MKDDVKSKLEQVNRDLQSLEENKKKLEQELESLQTTYHIGQRFIVHYLDGSDHENLLVQISPNMCCLVDLKNGNRVLDPILVENARKITWEELSEMTYSPVTLINET